MDIMWVDIGCCSDIVFVVFLILVFIVLNVVFVVLVMQRLMKYVCVFVKDFRGRILYIMF